MTKLVTLSSVELENAKEAGTGRNEINCAARHTPAEVAKRFLVNNIQGARAELAVAKYFGLPWTGRLFTAAGFREYQAKGGHDVGPLEVKSTRRADGCMRLPQNTPDGSPHVLVFAHGEDTYEIIGWCFGKEGKQAQYLTHPRNHGKPYYLVPRTVLRSIDELEAYPEVVQCRIND